MENVDNADKVAAARAALKARMTGGKGKNKAATRKSAAVIAAEAEAGKCKTKNRAGFEKKPGLSKLDAGFSH